MPAGESEGRAKTRARFDEVLKRYTDPTTSEQKKVKKKTPAQPKEESIVLQTLKQNLDLVKDTEKDETILQNTYQPDHGSPRFTKNKRRERELTEKVNNNRKQDEEDHPTKVKRKSKRNKELLPTPAQQEDSYIVQIDQTDSKPGNAKTSKSKASSELEDPGNVQRRKSKKVKSKGGGEGELGSDVQIGVAAEAGDELLREYQRQIVQEEARTTTKKTIAKSTRDRTNAATQEVVALNNEGAKKKKKKLRSSMESEREASMVEDRQTSQSEDISERRRAKEKRLETQQEEVEEYTVESLKSKKKKKRKQVKDKNDPEMAELPQRPVFDASLVLGIYIHRTDRLKTDLLVSHPMVKIHVIDEITGQYVKKEDSHRPVSSFYEQESVDHILPIITQPFDFKKNKSTVPEWEEQIIFNERFGYFLQVNNEGPRVMLFFEVLDFISMEEARANVDVDKHERGFRKIAWAFLKLVGTNGVLNIENKLRLQLYCPPPRGKRLDNTIEVVEWWRRYPHRRYASTLYVTVKGLKLPNHVDPSIRSMMALQQERGSTSFSELQSETTRRTVTQPLDNQAELLRWSRIPGQVCRIPNKPVLSFRGGQMGCFTVRFSHNGRMLAAACADRDAFPIIVYEIPSGTVLAAFNGHLSIVYDLCWSRDDQSLLSASSDGTVRMWNIQSLQAIAQKVLPHPSFVYCGQFHPVAQGLVVTGGYDCLVRVWRVDVKDVNGLLLQEFEGHKSFVNALCFDFEGNRMFSADNGGLIIAWRTSVDDITHQRPCRHWKIETEIAESELHGLPINTLEVHPNGRRLLIHAKDSVVRVMDLRVLAVKKYPGATNYRERIHSTFSPCGSFIFSGSEDGMAYVWNAETGDQVAVYSELCYPTALRGVAFHPHENMVAFCAFGQSQPVHVYVYDRKLAQLEGDSLKGRSMSGSADTTMFRKSSDPATCQDTSGSAMDRFVSAARLSMKMQRVKDKLDSVLEPSRNSSHLYEQGGISQMGRSLTQEAGPMCLSSSLPPLSFLSPHSKLQLSGSLGAQLIPQANLSSQIHGFSPVGQRLGRATSLRIQTSQLPTAIKGEADSLATVLPTVVSLYDYSANRSDELTVQRGDVIHVLYKDNDIWWFGRLTNGLQGYFPASYVVEEGDYNDGLSQGITGQAAQSEQTNLSAPLSGPWTDQSHARSTPTKVSATMVSGELRFISELDTDPEQSAAIKVKKKKKLVKKLEAPSSPTMATSSDPDAPGTSSMKTRTKASGSRPLPPPPRKGQFNSAFEHDA